MERKIENIFSQDSVLGTILTNVFASNLVTKVKTALLKFGDDIKLGGPLTQQKTQNKLGDLSNWSTKTKSGNGMKC